MSSDEKVAKQIGARLQDAIRVFPIEMFDSFKYTTRGNNLTHAIVLGALAKIMGDLPGVRHVAIDVHLNTKTGIKFQPDVVGYRELLLTTRARTRPMRGCRRNVVMLNIDGHNVRRVKFDLPPLGAPNVGESLH